MKTIRARTGRGALLALSLTIATLSPGKPAHAQDYTWAAAYNAGGVYFTKLNQNAGAVSGQAPFNVELDPGWVIGLQFEHWFAGGRLGARVNGALTQRPLSLPGRSLDVDVWMLDADLLLRLLPAEPWRTFNPFLSLGLGGVRYKLGEGDFINFGAADATYPGKDDPRAAATGGIGFDFITAWRWDENAVGIRVEAVDHVTLDSPFRRQDGTDFGPIHNVRFVIGLFSGFGVLH